MRLDNRTRYYDEDLRALLLACQRHIGHSFDKVRVVFVYCRGSGKEAGCTGLALLGRMRNGKRTLGSWARVRVAREPSQENRDDAARVIEHELRHVFGTDHNHMGISLRHCTKDQDITWAGDLPLRMHPAPVVVPPTPEELEQREIARHAAQQLRREAAVARREAHARSKVVELERRLKRTKTALSKWKTKVNYYERKAARRKS